MPLFKHQTSKDKTLKMRSIRALITIIFGFSLILLNGCSTTSKQFEPHNSNYVNLLEAKAENSINTRYNLGLLYLFGRIDHHPTNAIERPNKIAKEALHSIEALAEETRIEKGIKHLTIAAENNSQKAQILLGILYGFSENLKSELANPAYETLTVPQNLVLADEWLLHAAELNNPDAIYWRTLLAYRDKIRIDQQTAIAQLENAATNGHALSAALLSTIYHDNKWVSIDKQKELQYLTQAAQSGHAPSQNSLATAYFSGTLVEKDQARAFHWFSQAAYNGLAIAHFNVGVCFEGGYGTRKDLSEAITWYQLAATRNHIKAIKRLAKIYYFEDYEHQEPGIASIWFEQAAGLGDAEAQSNLGYLYSQGMGVPENPEQAVLWYRTAAMKGYLPAIHNLGMAHLLGYGLQADQNRAIKFLTASASSGYGRSQFVLGRLLIKANKKGSKQYQSGLDWMTKAAQQGFSEAATYLTKLGISHNK